MRKAKKARNIILTALITILCGSAALTAYASCSAIQAQGIKEASLSGSLL